MSLLNIRGLFWKFFLAFWGMSLVIMLATTYVVVHVVESKYFVAKHREQLTAVVKTIVDRHEAGDSVHPRELRHLLKGKPLGEVFRHRQVLITDGEKVIFSARRHKHKFVPDVDYLVNSSSGRAYRVKAHVSPPTYFLLVSMFRINTLQFVFVVIGAALFSILLSWFVVRPLKRLGESSRRYAEGGEEERIAPDLLARGDEIGVLARDLSFMMDEITRNMKVQKQLLHDVSHELRAPLTRLQVAAELINGSGGKAEDVQRVHKECERMSALIQQILDFSRMDNVSATRESCDVTSLIHEVVEGVCYEYRQCDIQVNLGEKRLILRVIPDLFAKAIENILRNACKHVPGNSPVELNIREHTQALDIVIRDHGPGVPLAEIERIKEPFFRSGNKMHTEGFGLGLSIAQRALEKCSASLDIRNHPEGGLEVIISFKLP